MKLKISELRRLEANATPGPWTNAGFEIEVSSGGLVDFENEIGSYKNRSDASFSAVVRNDLLQLLDIAEAACKYVDAASAIKSELVTDSQVEVDRYNDACSRLEELLKDVEMDDV